MKSVASGFMVGILYRQKMVQRLQYARLARPVDKSVFLLI